MKVQVTVSYHYTDYTATYEVDDAVVAAAISAEENVYKCVLDWQVVATGVVAVNKLFNGICYLVPARTGYTSAEELAQSRKIAEPQATTLSAKDLEPCTNWVRINEVNTLVPLAMEQKLLQKYEYGGPIFVVGPDKQVWCCHTLKAVLTAIRKYDE
jgi:hypothetical protein